MMNVRVIIASHCVLHAIACVAAVHRAPPGYPAWLPSAAHVDLHGDFTLSPAGDLSLALAQPCTVERLEVHGVNGVASRDTVPCDSKRLSTIHVVATTPWHSQVPGVWTDAGHLVFQVKWRDRDLDQLNDDLPAMVAQPWALSESAWTPSATQADQLLQLAKAVVASEPAPGLEITRFEVSDGTLRAGGESTLTVEIYNRGPGTAYGVNATTQSGVKDLHGRRMPFGAIKPGTSMRRELLLSVPSSETSPDTMLVLVFREANGHSPTTAPHRIPIAAPTTTPLLAVSCVIPGRSPSRPELDAGEDVVLRCQVNNAGAEAADVDLEVSIAGEHTVQPPAQNVAPGGHAAFDIHIPIPDELAIDSVVEIAITARDRRLAHWAHMNMTGVIHKQQLCVAGKLTRAQYNAKLAKMRSQVADGAMTHADYDRLDATLVSCLPP